MLFALIRGLMKVREKGIGNFWADLVRATLYVMMPLCIVVTIALIALGVPQSLGGGKTVDILEPIAVVQTADGYEVLSDAEIDPETDAVMVDGEVVPEAKICLLYTSALAVVFRAAVGFIVQRIARRGPAATAAGGLFHPCQRQRADGVVILIGKISGHGKLDTSGFICDCNLLNLSLIHILHCNT